MALEGYAAAAWQGSGPSVTGSEPESARRGDDFEGFSAGFRVTDFSFTG